MAVGQPLLIRISRQARWVQTPCQHTSVQLVSSQLKPGKAVSFCALLSLSHHDRPVNEAGQWRDGAKATLRAVCWLFLRLWWSSQVI